ncbi:MAG: bifunctional glutamate N-acetyltransferase/amino-acid acetyltransferase ArgJ [Chthoniobacterales bacterium]
MSKNLKRIAGGVNAARGFLSAAAACGIKRTGPLRSDLCIVASATPATAAGVFTTNLVKAAPVLLSRRHLESGKARAVLLNSGNANACTGTPGLRAAEQCANAAAVALGIHADEVLVCSTGRIGVQLPLPKMLTGIREAAASLKASPAAALAAAKSIMTSDSLPKQAAYEVKVDAKSFRIGGMAKGAGMISPNMATMLCVITTDAAVPATFLRKALREATGRTFNCITVDGDCSTNDTVLTIANGASKVAIRTAPEKKAFADALQAVCADLARSIVADGEGTSRVIELIVKGAKTEADAHRIGRAIANSQLVKCAWAGSDPNWGRILDAAGYAGAALDPDKVDIAYDGIKAARNGMGCQDAKGEAKLRKIAAKKEFSVLVDLHLGKGEAHLLTTDLTEEYVRLNLSEFSL